MKVQIEISAEHYEPFVAECNIASPEYSILKNGMIVQAQDAEQRRILIQCDMGQAALLLMKAEYSYPAAASAIARGIDRSRSPSARSTKKSVS